MSAKPRPPKLLPVRLPLDQICQGQREIVGRVFDGAVDPLRARPFHNAEEDDIRVEGVTFQDCTFRSCFLNTTKFVRCRFVNCRFQRVSSYACSLYDSVVESCRFYQTRAVWLIFNSLSTSPDIARVADCEFRESLFVKSSATRAEISRCDLEIETRECELMQPRVRDCVVAGILTETVVWGKNWYIHGAYNGEPILERVDLSGATMSYCELCGMDGAGVKWPTGEDYIVVADLDRAKTDLANYLATLPGDHERTLRMLTGAPQRRKGTKVFVISLKDYQSDARVVGEFLRGGGYEYRG